GFLAMFGQDSKLDLAFLNVKHGVGDVALLEHVLIFMEFQYLFSRAHFGEKLFRVKHVLEYDSLARDGGLMSYGPDLKESLQRAAAMVDRIFRGAKPSELPFKQPTHYLFVVN